MKKYFKLLSIFITISLLSSCSNAKETVSEQTINSVSVIPAYTQSYENTISYSGFVTADEVKRLSFELSGKIKNIYVEEGEGIKKGQILADLDTKTIQLAIDNAKENISLANNQIEQINSGIEKINIGLESEKLTLSKAQTALDAEKTKLDKINSTYQSSIAKVQLQYDNIKDTYEDTQKLYNKGVVSKSDYDKAKLAFDTINEELASAIDSRDKDIELQQKSIDAAQETYDLQLTAIKNMENELESAKLKKESANIALNQANISLNQNNKYLSDSVIKSTIDGYVMSVTLKSGEITSAGTPVVVLKSGAPIITVGIPSEDFDKITQGMNVLLEADGKSCNGVVTKISLYPDEVTRTYKIEITPEQNLFPMGGLVNIKIPLDEKSGCFIPISAITNIDGVDYVYCAKGNENNEYKIVRYEVKIADTIGENVNVTGINAGDLIVFRNLKNLNEGQIVNINEN